eukprot:TRINITY_DN1665_c0_g1_i3.p1 TRINITY_DN1665_c0_g1~~TRINITY_DN1665_c0_g1_i3.p1  ORF type:complete len:416 (-),score=115.71 TRINITY_DN1665_c0_g1_i3:864-2111(-)
MLRFFKANDSLFKHATQVQDEDEDADLEDHHIPKSAFALEAAIEHFDKWLTSSAEDHKQDVDGGFIKAVLPMVVQWTLEFPEDELLLPILSKFNATSVRLSRRQVRYLLANAFFLNCKTLCEENHHIGDISFKKLYFGSPKHKVTVQRIVCLLSYFWQVVNVSEEFLNEVVEFKRVVLTELPNWGSFQDVLIPVDVAHVHSGSMEDPNAPAFVNFANEQLHIGQIIPSCTQEEVLFSAAPESFIGLLFCEKLEDNEAFLFSNLRRFNKYSGYLDSFAFDGKYPGMHTFDQVVIDAVYFDHWTEYSLRRDLNKAYLAFAACERTPISTGHWGCGMFGGDKLCKFVQQVMAATLANRKLEYSTFKDLRTEKTLQDLLNQIVSKHVSLGKLFEFLMGAEEGMLDFDTFEEYINSRLSS